MSGVSSGSVEVEYLAHFGPLRPLLGELNDLKRVRVAGHPLSLAAQGFQRSWARFVGGESVIQVARRESAFALASARLGGIDAAVLADGGLDRGAVRDVLWLAISEIGQPLGDPCLNWLRLGVDELAEASGRDLNAGVVPEFVERLQTQPRAGATRPGHPRLILEPPENHAEHCYLTAVYAALATVMTEGDPGIAFLAGLAHHLHNAYLPDSGFTGEELLGTHLLPLMDRFTDRAIAQLPENLVNPVRAARGVLPDIATPEGRAFHAGDVWDRVLQMEQYARVAAFETRQALVDLDLVHPGPLLAFQRAVLNAVGLMS